MLLLRFNAQLLAWPNLLVQQPGHERLDLELRGAHEPRLEAHCQGIEGVPDKETQLILLNF